LTSKASEIFLFVFVRFFGNGNEFLGEVSFCQIQSLFKGIYTV